MKWAKSELLTQPRSAEEERDTVAEQLQIDTQVKLYELLVAKGLTQAELAKRMGISPARVNQYFKADKNMTLRTLAQICLALDVTARVETTPRGEPGLVTATSSRTRRSKAMAAFHSKTEYDCTAEVECEELDLVPPVPGGGRASRYSNVERDNVYSFPTGSISPLATAS